MSKSGVDTLAVLGISKEIYQSCLVEHLKDLGFNIESKEVYKLPIRKKIISITSGIETVD